MTNWEYLEALANDAPSKLQAWFDSEHVETPNDTSHGDTAALDAKYDDGSREKLEADVREIADAYNMGTQRHGTERFAHELYFSIIHLLDRQAAITEAWCDREFEAACNSCALKIDLLEEVDRLTAELETARRDCERYRNKFGKCIDYADAIHALMDEGMA